MLEKVDYQSLDMRAIVVLIRHDHYAAVAKCQEVIWARVVSLKLQADDLHQILYFLVLQKHF